MARKNEYGKYILSAGEIGAYTVCPEAWRLNNVVKVTTQKSLERIERGNALHQEWAKNYDEAIYFTRHIRLIVSLVILTILIFLLTAK